MQYNASDDYTISKVTTTTHEMYSVSKLEIDQQSSGPPTKSD